MISQARFNSTIILAAVTFALASLTPQGALAAPVAGEAVGPTEQRPVVKGDGGEADGEAGGEAGGETPESLRQKALERFQSEDFAGAIEFFNRAYAVDPNPNYLFNIGRVYEEAGNLEESLVYYERFIKEPGVDLDSRGIALERLQLLRAVLVETTKAKEPEPEPEPAPEPAPAPAPEPEPEPEPEPKRGKALRNAGYTLLGVGGVALIGGGVFGGVALSQSKQLETTDKFAPRQSLITTGETNATIADALLISGGVVAATGLILVIASLRGRNGKKADLQARKRNILPVVGRQVVGVALGGRF